MKELEPGKAEFTLIQFCGLLLSYPVLCLQGGAMFELPMSLWSQGQNELSLKTTKGEHQIKYTYMFSPLLDCVAGHSLKVSS